MGKTEVVRACAQSFGNVNLHASIGYVVFPADNVADPGFQIIHNGSECVQDRAIGPDQNRIGDRRQLDLTFPHYKVAPANNATGEFEAPVRHLAVGFCLCALLFGHAEHGAIVHRGTALADLGFALCGQFLLAFKAGVQVAGCLQFFNGGRIAVQPLGLAEGFVPRNAHPFQILLNGTNQFLAGATGICIINTQLEFATVAAGKQGVGKGKAGIAHMQEAGRAGRKAEFHNRGLCRDWAGKTSTKRTENRAGAPCHRQFWPPCQRVA